MQGTEYSFVEVNESSKWLPKIQQLGDSQRGTIGFMPSQAYMDYAKKGCILAVVSGMELIGYIMYRYKNTAIIIVHLCVSPQHRCCGYARRLVDTLLNKEAAFVSHLQLSCRRDYGLKNFWHSLGFMPISERAGRAINYNTTLTTWVKNNPYCQNLFTTFSDIKNDRACIVLDTNIVIDICQESNNESLALRQNFLIDYASFCISPIVLDEIDQNDDMTVRNAHREFAKGNFPILTTCSQAELEAITTEILSQNATREFSNTWYDISHVAYAIASGADAFITRDDAWLNAKITDWIYQKYGLSIMSPGEFVKHVDELSSPAMYAPQKLVGLDISFSELQTIDFGATTAAFYSLYGNKRKATFEKTLRNWMSRPEKNRILLVKAKNTPICLAPYIIDQSSMIVHDFLFNPSGVIKPSLIQTFIKRMAFKLIDISIQVGVHRIEIHKNTLDPKIEDAFIACGYIKTADILLKIMDARIIKESELSIIKELPEAAPLNTAISSFLSSDSSQVQSIIEIEKALWPLKIKSTVPCYIVPIKADYAIELFDEALSNTNPSLFHNLKIAPALNIENVYFKSSRKSISSPPGRILWYVSKSSQIGTGAIRACSYLDSVEVGDVRILYKKYQRLGVLDWTRLARMQDNNHCIAAYKFSYTESFSQPIMLDEIRKIINNSGATFQSYISITADQFAEIYKRGTGRE